MRDCVDTQGVEIDAVKKKIDDMLEESRKRRMTFAVNCEFDNPNWICEVGYKQALIELKQFLKGDSNENTN